MIRMRGDQTLKIAKATKVILKLNNNQNRMHLLFKQKLDFSTEKKLKQLNRKIKKRLKSQPAFQITFNLLLEKLKNLNQVMIQHQKYTKNLLEQRIKQWAQNKMILISMVEEYLLETLKNLEGIFKETYIKDGL